MKTKFIQLSSWFTVFSLSSVLLFSVVSCNKDDSKEKGEKEETRGIVATSAADFLSKMNADYVDKKDLQNFVASSVDHNKFQEFLSEIYVCPFIMEPTLMSNEYYQSNFGTTRILLANQFCYELFTVNQSGGSFITCPIRGIVVVECNNKTSKYYVIEYKQK